MDQKEDGAGSSDGGFKANTYEAWKTEYSDYVQSLEKLKVCVMMERVSGG